jgi:hypothetical protein
MARTTTTELAALRNAATDCVTTSARLRDQGMSNSTIAARCRPGGPWRRLLPGVVMLSRSEPTRRQQLLAAVYYTGPDSVVSGLDALQAYGVALQPRPDIQVQVLVPPERRMLPREFVSVERTSRVPTALREGGIPFSPPTRATIDAARRELDPDQLRRILSLPVRSGLCRVEDLRAELDAGNQRGSAAVREMLRDLGLMRSTCAQDAARELLRRVPLPPPIWDMTICDLRGRPIGTVDAWWDEVALGWQFHAGTSENNPKINHLALTAAGVIIVQTQLDQLRVQNGKIARELVSAFAGAAKRRRPKVLAFGPAAAGTRTSCQLQKPRTENNSPTRLTIRTNKMK